MINKVMLIGNLGKDPETRSTQSGSSIANVTMATSRQWKDRDGNRQEDTEWHRVVFFGKLAEIVGKYLTKGSRVYVEGRLQTRKWQDQNGQDRWTTEIVAEEMKMLGGDRPQQPSQPQPRQNPRQPQAPMNQDFDDEIPF